MTATDEAEYALVDAYESWDEDEGFFDVYVCGACGEYLLSDFAIWFEGKERQKVCPKCGRKLRW